MYITPILFSLKKPKTKHQYDTNNIFDLFNFYWFLHFAVKVGQL